MCDECENAEAPAVQGLLPMELIGALSNPEVGQKLDRLAEALAALKPKLASHKIVLRKLPLTQGRVLRTVEQVLSEHPEGLQAFEVRRCVESEIGRKLPKSTVKDALARNPVFERIGHGRYRLRQGPESAGEGGPASPESRP